MADDGHEVALSRVFTFRTEKPLSSLWKVTRSTDLTRVSLGGVASWEGFKAVGQDQCVTGCHPITGFEGR